MGALIVTSLFGGGDVGGYNQQGWLHTGDSSLGVMMSIKWKGQQRYVS